MEKICKRTMSLFIAIILIVSVCSNVAVFADDSIFDISAYDKTELSSYTFENDMPEITKGNYAEYGASLWGENSPFDKHWGFNIQKGSATLKTENKTATITSTGDWRMYLSFSNYDCDASENYDFSNKIMYYSFTYSGENEWNQIGFYSGDQQLYWIGSNNIYDAVRIGNADGVGINASSGDSITVITDNVEKKYYFFVNDKLAKTFAITNDRIIRGIIFNPSGNAYISISNFKFGELKEKDIGEEKVTVTVSDDIEHGTVTVPKSEYTIGSIVEVTVTPQTGYVLKTLMANDVDITTDKQFTVTGETTITATFEKEQGKVVNESFYDAFDDQTNWTVINGDWAIQDESGEKILSQTSINLDNATIHATDRIYTDAIYEVDVRYNATNSSQWYNNWCGISFRKSNQDTDWHDTSGYLFFLRVNGWMGLCKGNAADLSKDREKLSTGGANVDDNQNPLGKTRHLKIVNVGNNIKIFTDNEAEPIYNWTDESNHATSGYFALNTNNSAWSFDNLYVRIDGDLVNTSGFIDLNSPQDVTVPVVLFNKTVSKINVVGSDGQGEKELTADDYTSANSEAENLTTYTIKSDSLSTLSEGNHKIKFGFDDETSSEYELYVGRDLGTGDKTTLLAAITEAKQLREFDYTPESWSILQTALTAAEEVNNTRFPTEEAVNGAISGLNSAITALAAKDVIVDKTALNAAIEKAEGLTANDYTATTWARFAAVLSEIKTVAGDSAATQEEADSALRALTLANQNLAKAYSASSATYTDITDLKTNDLVNPYGIDLTPVFSWKMESNVVGQEQTAYQIKVSANSDMSEPIWDLGKVESDASTGIRYTGKALTSSTTYYWSVSVWDKDGNELAAKTSRFTTALLESDAWTAPKFITPASAAPTDKNGVPTFRKEFTTDKTISKAVLYSTARGVYDAFINGKRVGEKLEDGSIVYDELKPGYTDMGKRVQYQSYDVTYMLNPTGANTISAIVSNGWWNNMVNGDVWNKNKLPNSFCAQLHLTYTDGSTDVIETDATWQARYGGPVLYGDIFHGETYDATADITWMENGFTGDGWSAAAEQNFSGKIVAQRGQKARIRDDLDLPAVSAVVYEGAVQATSTQFGIINTKAVYGAGDSFMLKKGQTAVIDFGQNLAGWSEIEVEGARGTVITMRHGEMLNDNKGLKSRGNDGPEGSVYLANMRGAETTGTYIMSGKGKEKYQESHTYYGFRYITMTVTEDITVHSVTGKVLTSIEKQTGYIYTSNSLVNQLHSNAFWGQLANYISVPTDCPQRSERQGWGADTWVFSKTGAYNGEIYGFLSKWMMDMQDAQLHNNQYDNDGNYGVTAPYWITGVNKAVGWADAGVIVPYNMYKMYGDKTIIEENYESMQKYVNIYLHGHNHPAGAGNSRDYGDWLYDELNTTQIKEYLGTVFLAWDYQMMAEMADLLGKTEDAAQYRTWFDEVKTYFNTTYVDADGMVKISGQSEALGTQPTAYLYALKLGLLPSDESVQKNLNALITRIENNGNKLETGFLGTAILLQTLTDFGYGDVAYKLLLQEGYPSWLYTVNQGATTFWERWNSYSFENGFGPVDMNSFNHYSFGVVVEWMYAYMTGITYDAPGFKHIVLQPLPNSSDDITFADGSYDSVYGLIESSWEQKDGKLLYSATVPANTTATLYLPASEKATESLKAEHKVIDGVTYLGTQIHNGIKTARFELLSGGYDFIVSDNSVDVFLKDEYKSSSSKYALYQDEKVLTCIPATGDVSFEAKLTLSQKRPVSLIAALYEGEILIDAKLETFSSPSIDANIPIALPEERSNIKLRIFLWDLETMQPLRDLLEYKIE